VRGEFSVGRQAAARVPEPPDPELRRLAQLAIDTGVDAAFSDGRPPAEIDAEVILMAKNKVDGVYDADPRVVPGAKKYEQLTYQEMLEKRLTVMDQTAAALAAEREIDILVFDVSERGSMRRAVLGEHVGTLVHAG